MQSSTGWRENSMEEDQGRDAMGRKKIIDRMFLSLSQIAALSEQNVEGVQKMLEEILNFKQLKMSLREAVLLDYYTAGFCWAKGMNFSLIQLSGFMDLLNFLLENLRDKHMTLGDNLKELGKAMAGIGETDLERGGDLNFFSIEQAKAIIDYLTISLFKDYKVYEYLFHSDSEELVISNEYVTELAQLAVPSFPALLEEGTPSDTCSSLIISPTAAETESKGSDQNGYVEEPCPEPESFEADAVGAVTAKDQMSAVDEIPNEIIGNLEDESILWPNTGWMLGMKTSEMEIPRAKEKRELKQKWKVGADPYASVKTQAEPHRGIFTATPDCVEVTHRREKS
ncbi:ciliary-associated calcium-binding coiled-coil protein 1 isoform X2 [Cuculus canorus]|uniref:ciliary-associated calcium-binding coiled-coil protein 1 isoform X2 n=1 Tax=Cuculus canorus TaxID=55661 RepID=UPI0023AA35AA|nr:ciliary-associated calcium-binding coiled-coil protein 1 isoform X2 [Cuculus canorus]